MITRRTWIANTIPAALVPAAVAAQATADPQIDALIAEVEGRVGGREQAALLLAGQIAGSYEMSGDYDEGFTNLSDEECARRLAHWRAVEARLRARVRPLS